MEMKALLIYSFLSVTVLLTPAAPSVPNDLEEWIKFKVSYGKTYKSKEEELLRMRTFLENKKRVEKHNEDHRRGLFTFKTEINRFSDLSSEEFNSKKRGSSSLIRSYRNDLLISHSPIVNPVKLPRSVNWTSKGAVTEVKDQENCLACWIFSAVGAVESQHFLKSGELVSLSEQNVVDCFNGSHDSENCPIGWMDTAFEYILYHGIETEKSYPYEGKVGSCRADKSTFRVNISSYADLPIANEAALRRAVALIGPVSVAIDSKDGNFRHYRSGIYFSEACKSGEKDLDHALLIVGYGSENGQAYWLVKNSWGTSWGEQGYGKIARNKHNHCGIATKASYPLINDSQQ